VAQIREIRLVDDLDGEAADETVEFGIDGKSYEIDLSKDNAGRLRDALAEFVSAARDRLPAPVAEQGAEALSARQEAASGRIHDIQIGRDLGQLDRAFREEGVEAALDQVH